MTNRLQKTFNKHQNTHGLSNTTLPLHIYGRMRMFSCSHGLALLIQ